MLTRQDIETAEAIARVATRYASAEECAALRRVIEAARAKQRETEWAAKFAGQFGPRAKQEAA